MTRAAGDSAEDDCRPGGPTPNDRGPGRSKARQRVHLDHNATAPLRPEVAELLAELGPRLGGNPSSLHAGGRAARALVDGARERVAAALGVLEDEVVFTSGGTESNNLAVLGCVRAAPRGPGGPPGLVTSPVEHASVLGPAARLEREGHPWRRVGVDATGRVDPEQVAARAAEGPTALVSIQAAGNEVGQLMPLARVGEALGGLPARPTLHTDAVQALGRVPLELEAWGVDLATLSAHKVGGPVGVGVLVRRGGVPLEPLAYGGSQEGGLRPGTEDAAGVSAAALAIELAVAERATHAEHLHGLASALLRELRAAFPDALLLGPPLGDDLDRAVAAGRLPGTLNVLIPRVEGKVLVTRLDLAGLEASAGSACASGSLEPSHVLTAMGLEPDRARAGLRLSVGRDTTWKDIAQAVDILRTIR